MRKLAEMSIALQLERKYDKDEILEMYINQVNFGAGNWGVSRAAAAYFNKSVSELTIGESALLAGLVQAPNYYAPVEDWDRAITRQRYVLSRMVEYGYITSEQAAAEVYQEGSDFDLARRSGNKGFPPIQVTAVTAPGLAHYYRIMGNKIWGEVCC